MSEPVTSGTHFKLQGATALLTLDDASSRNAFAGPVRDGLRNALTEIRNNRSIRAVVLTGANGAFCAGGDLRALSTAHEQPSDVLRDRMRNSNAIFRDLLTLDIPVIAAVDGAAFGAGFSLALTADFVLVSPRARFCMVFSRIGLVPDCGATYTLPRAVGAQRARELLLSTREVDADEALRLGIAMERHDSDQLLPRALALAESFATSAPLSTAMIKRMALDAGALEAALEAEANAQALCFQTAAFREAVERFFNKQPPAFRWPVNKEQ
ncbi:enoyl-CoA hydratase/isomerase family protein [Ottowia sp.]|uniref:enoyl-CoA hydratase/isomerase family protein n=1 Tax=Ottowia sp. TaxID=1898956 RepID=UPI003A8AA03D